MSSIDSVLQELFTIVQEISPDSLRNIHVLAVVPQIANLIDTHSAITKKVLAKIGPSANVHVSCTTQSHLTSFLTELVNSSSLDSMACCTWLVGEGDPMKFVLIDFQKEEVR
jgi:hypothetical protein